MKYRNRTNSQLDKLDGVLQNLDRIVNRQEPVEVFRANVQKARDIVGEVRSIVEAEPLSPNEINHY